jgi:hypothetical protein
LSPLESRAVESQVKKVSASASVAVPSASAEVRRTVASKADAGGERADFVFLHHRALNAAGSEMMEKTTAAMEKLHSGIKGGAVYIDLPLPPARVYVVLGSFALKKFFPTLRGAPGQWLKTEDGADVLVSNSPEYILRFGVETEAVKKIKQDMWRSLKTVVQRLAS